MNSSASSDRGRWVAPTLLCVFIAAFTLVSGYHLARVYEAGHGPYLQDMASLNQAIWNTAHGRPLQATILFEGIRDHFEPMLALYSLAYVAGGDITTLVFWVSFLVALGAIPWYMLGRRVDGSQGISLLLAGCYLLFPPIHKALEINYVRPDLLFFPVLSVLAYALVFENRRLGIIAVIAALACKESAGFVILGVGLFGLFSRPRAWPTRRESIVLLILGSVWAPLISGVLLPAAGIERIQHFERFRPLSKLGVGLMRWAKTITYPALVAILAMLAWRRRREWIIALPHVIGLAFFWVRLRYLIPALPVPLFVAAHEALSWGTAAKRRLVLGSLVVFFAAANIHLGFWMIPAPDPRIEAARPLLAQIPDTASLCTERKLLVHGSSRERVYQFNRRHYFPADSRDYLDSEYFLLDRTDLEKTRAPGPRWPTREQAFEELDSLDLTIVGSQPPWTLYRREADLLSSSQ